jgi:hypothetical protein
MRHVKIWIVLEPVQRSVPFDDLERKSNNGLYDK